MNYFYDKNDPMKFHNLSPMLWVPDLRQSVSFYTDILGFTCGEYSEEWQWATVSRDNVEIMFAKPNAHTAYNGPAFTGSLYIRVDDADALWNDWKDRVDVVYAIDTFDYGMRDFAIRDNNGFMLQFGHEVVR